MDKLIEEAKKRIEEVRGKYVKGIRGGRNYVVSYEVRNRHLIATLKSGVRLWAIIR